MKTLFFCFFFFFDSFVIHYLLFLFLHTKKAKFDFPLHCVIMTCLLMMMEIRILNVIL